MTERSSKGFNVEVKVTWKDKLQSSLELVVGIQNDKGVPIKPIMSGIC